MLLVDWLRGSGPECETHHRMVHVESAKTFPWSALTRGCAKRDR
jgi:hypothetical protein